MRIGSVLKNPIEELEKTLAALRAEQDKSLRFIETVQQGMTNRETEIAGYERAIRELQEKSNEI